MRHACKDMIKPYDPKFGETFYTYRNSSGTQRYGLACPYDIALVYRPSSEIYPQIRSVAVCTSSYYLLPSDSSHNLTTGCSSMTRLEPALVRNRTTNVWEFKLEEVPFTCGCYEKSEDY